MKLERRKIKKARIEMIPLIDTFFLVLVFFIYGVLSMVVHRGIPVKLPQAATSVPDQKDYLAVTLLPGGVILVNEEPCPLGQLQQKLGELRPAQKDKPLYLNADRAVPHGSVVEVLDAIRGAGFEKVVIEAAEKKKG